MEPKDPQWRERRQQRFGEAAFIQDLGLTLADFGPGWAETGLIVQPKHAQQDGFVHAGVQATMADHTAGTAAATLIGPDELVLTAEFKINLLRPAVGERLSCRAEVIKPGKRLTVVESKVYAHGETPVLVALAVVTLAVLAKGEMG